MPALTDRLRQDGPDAVLDLEPGEAAQLPLTEGWCLMSFIHGHLVDGFAPAGTDIEALMEAAIAWIVGSPGDVYLARLEDGSLRRLMRMYYGDDTSYGRMQAVFRLELEQAA